MHVVCSGGKLCAGSRVFFRRVSNFGKWKLPSPTNCRRDGSCVRLIPIVEYLYGVSDLSEAQTIEDLLEFRAARCCKITDGSYAKLKPHSCVTL